MAAEAGDAGLGAEVGQQAEAPAIDLPALAGRIDQLARQERGGMTGIPFPVKPFSFESEEMFLTFLEDYKTLASVCAWDNAKTARMLPAFLHGLALTIYRELDAEIKMDWLRLQAALLQKFLPPEHTRFHSSALLTTVQDQGESVDKFAARVRTLAHNAYPFMQPPDRKEIERDFFINGLKFNIKRHILVNHPGSSYDEALAFAHSFESGSKLAQGVSHPLCKFMWGLL